MLPAPPLSKTPEPRSLRRLPSVEKLVSQPAFEALSREFGRALVVAETRAFLGELRRESSEAAIGRGLEGFEAALWARLREGRTTNKTPLADYASVIGPETGAILRVHPSNFRIVGFTESAATEELVRLGRERGLAVIEESRRFPRASRAESTFVSFPATSFSEGRKRGS